MASEITELRRLNPHELKIITDALELLKSSSNRRYAGSAKIMLENDAEFVRGLFWSK